MQYSRLLAFTILAVANLSGTFGAVVREPALATRQTKNTGRTTPLLKSIYLVGGLSRWR
jgi:hypothetical protein